jgi:tetratricopeptide (TPR) repeat protein
MKRHLGVIIFLVYNSLQLLAQDSASVSQNIDTTTYVYGNVMYENGNYDAATGVYEQLLAKNGPSDEIYFNLGNCFYKSNAYGKAILNYERALFFNPGNEDAQYNLELANQRIRDQIEPVNESIFTIWWNNFIQIFTAHTWTILAVIFIWMALAGFVIYRLPKFVAWQRPGFFVFAITLLLAIVFCVAGLGRNNFDNKYQFAIVMAPSAIVKSEPSENSTNLFLLHEGIKLKLMRSDEGWTEIKIPNGEVGWIKSDEITAVDPFMPGKN